MEGGQEGEERKGAAPVPLIDDSSYIDVTDNTNETIASRSCSGLVIHPFMFADRVPLVLW